MRKEYRDFDENYIEGKVIVIGDTVFVKYMENTLNRLLGNHYYDPAYARISIYGKIIEIKKNSYLVEILELVDTNLIGIGGEEKLIGKIVNAPSKKCLQWGKDTIDKGMSYSYCHWLGD